MSDSILNASWRDTARRLASEFDERLGSPAAEIVTFEATQRAIAVGIALAGACARLPIGRLLESNSREMPLRGAFDRRIASAVTPTTEAAVREFARIHRVIVVGVTRCVNRVYVLRGSGDKMYALHGVGSEEVEADLLADMDAIAARLAETD